MRTGVGKPANRVVIGDIRDDFATKVYKGKQDPYVTGGPRADSAFTENSPVPPPAMTPPPGLSSGSPIARSLSGNTIVPIQREAEAQPTREPSYIEIVEQVIPAPAMNQLARVQAAHADLVDALHKLGHRADDVAQMGLEQARESFYNALDAFTQPFVSWRRHIYNLIVASEAYRAGRDDELADNFRVLFDAWEDDELRPMRAPIEIGLTQQTVNLLTTLATLTDSNLPPLTPREKQKWGERDAQIRKLAENMRLDIVKLTSHIVEALEPSLLGVEAIQLSHKVYTQAKPMLSPSNTLYNRGAVALAIHRILPSLKGGTRTAATHTVAMAYHTLIRTENSEQNASLIRSYGNLALHASDVMIRSLRAYLKPSLQTLDGIIENGESASVQVAATRTRDIFLNRLSAIDA